jgi:hypothetical protein
MPILAIVPYLPVHALSWPISLWTNKLARYLIVAALLLGAGFGIKVYLQWDLISEAQIQAETTRTTEQARADRSESENVARCPRGAVARRAADRKPRRVVI